jgi:hypothetical protein
VAGQRIGGFVPAGKAKPIRSLKNFFRAEKVGYVRLAWGEELETNIFSQNCAPDFLSASGHL